MIICNQSSAGETERIWSSSLGSDFATLPKYQFISNCMPHYQGNIFKTLLQEKLVPHWKRKNRQALIQVQKKGINEDTGLWETKTK